MTAPVFKIGTIVSYLGIPGHRDEGAFEIIRLLPADGPEPQYRLRNVADLRERVAQQHELQLLRGDPAQAAAIQRPGRKLPPRHERRRS